MLLRLLSCRADNFYFVVTAERDGYMGTTMYQVKDIMTTQVIAVSPEATIDEAVSLLLDHKVSGLPVVDEQQRLLGVISEIDIIDLVYETSIELSKVRDHMTLEVRTLDCESSVDDAASIFCTKAIRRIPVTKEGKLVGVVSRRDLIRFVRDIRKQMPVVNKQGQTTSSRQT